MKKHLVTLWFDLPNGESYSFIGLVSGLEINGKIVVSQSKIFKQAFGFDLPSHSRVIWG